MTGDAAHPVRGRPGPISDRQTFELLRRTSLRSRAGPVTVAFVGGGGSGHDPRVAFSVGRKVGGAVERNRVRRRLRAIARELLPARPPGAYLIGVSPQAAKLSFGELRANVQRALDTLGRAGAR